MKRETRLAFQSSEVQRECIWRELLEVMSVWFREQNSNRDLVVSVQYFCWYAYDSLWGDIE